MDAELLARARLGLEAWQRGDVSALESLLDPDVELLWWQAGDWDCHGRQAVMDLLRERGQAGARGATAELIEASEQVLVVFRIDPVTEGPQVGLKPATVVTFRNNRVVSMRQFRSLDEALAATRM